MKPFLAVFAAAAILLGTFFAGASYGRGAHSCTLELCPALTEAQAPVNPPALSCQKADPFPININTASALELTLLPGIGEVLSRRIVEHRAVHGEFTAIEELMDVYGISEKRFAQVKDYITTGG